MLGVGAAAAAGPDRHRRHAAWVKPGVHTRQPQKTVQEETTTNEQDDGHGEFHRDDHVVRAAAAGTRYDQLDDRCPTSSDSGDSA